MSHETFRKSCGYFSPVNLPVSIFVLFQIQDPVRDLTVHLSCLFILLSSRNAPQLFFFLTFSLN